MKRYYLILIAFIAMFYSSFAYQIGGGFSYSILGTDENQSLLIVLYSMPKISYDDLAEQRLSLINTNTGETISWFETHRFSEFMSTILSINKSNNRIKLENNDTIVIYDYLTGNLITEDESEYAPLTILTDTYGVEINNIEYKMAIAGEYIDISNDLGCFEGMIQIKDKTNLKLLNIVPETFIGTKFYDSYVCNADKSMIAFIGNLQINDDVNQNEILSIYDVKNNSIKRVLNPVPTSILGFNSDNTKLSIYSNSKLFYYDYESNQITDSLEYVNNKSFVNIEKNNKYFVLTNGNTIEVYDGTGQQLIQSFVKGENSSNWLISEDSKFFYEYSNLEVSTYNIETGEKLTKHIPNFYALIGNNPYKTYSLSNDGKYILTKYYNNEGKNYNFTSWSVEEDKAVYTQIAKEKDADAKRIKYISAPHSISFQVEDFGNTMATFNKLYFEMTNLINYASCEAENSYIIETVNNGTEVLSYSCGGILSKYNICDQAISEVVENKIEVNSLEFYPNPTDNHITIKDLSIGYNTINIINTGGEIVVSVTKYQDSNSECKIDLSELNSGNYIIEVINGKDKRSGKISIAK